MQWASTIWLVITFKKHSRKISPSQESAKRKMVIITNWIYSTFNKTDFIGERPLYTLGGSKYHELMYNLGIALLHAGRATQAFDCLIIAVRRYHRNSRLWLRLAECCIRVHKEVNGTKCFFKIMSKCVSSQMKSILRSRSDKRNL